MSNDGAQYLAKTEANAVAVDFPIEKHRTPLMSTVHDFQAHRLLLGQNISLIENLINLYRLVGREFQLWALPLKLQDGEGTTSIAYAIIT